MTECANGMRRVLRVLLYWVTAIAFVSMPTFVYAQIATDSTTDVPAQTLFLPNVVTTSASELSPEDPPGESLSSEERMEIVQEVETRVNALLPPIGTLLEERNFVQEVELLGSELLSIPGVLATFVSTSTLTLQVVMEDGTSITLVNNRPVEPPLSAQAAQTAAEQFVAQNVAPQAIPGSNQAVVANFDGGDTVAAAIRSLLSDAGYNVLSLDASLSAMQNYKNLGLLYLDTHGVQFQKFSVVTEPDGSKALTGGSMAYGLQTSTQVSVSTMDTYKTMLNNGEIILSLGEETTGRTVKFAITEKFIATYWSFDKALAIIHACFGGAAPFKPGATCHGSGCFNPGEPGVLDPSALRSAMMAKGADVVVSFDNLTSTDYAWSSMLFLLDRLLGSNDVQSVNTPPLRPFPLDEVRAEMAQRNLLSFFKPNKVIFGFEYGGGNSVNLTFDTRDEQASLAPSINRITVLDDPAESEGKLKIEGRFADKQGTVTLDGIAATIASWTESEITVNTPAKGNGSAGDLLIEGPGEVRSNPVPLSLWQGTFEVQLIPGLGTLEATAHLNLHFRADIHKSRASLNATPAVPSQEVYLNPGDNSHVTASGTYVDPDSGDRISWSDGGKVRVMSNALVDTLAQSSPNATMSSIPDAGFAGGLVLLNPDTGSARFCFTMNAFYEMSIESSEGSYTTFGAISPGLPDGSRGLLSCFNTTLRGNYTVASGSRTIDIESTTILVKWSEFAPVSPPTDQTPG